MSWYGKIILGKHSALSSTIVMLVQTSGVTCTRGYQQQFLKLSSTYLKAEVR